jgi:hypothetical protein
MIYSVTNPKDPVNIFSRGAEKVKLRFYNLATPRCPGMVDLASAYG